MGKEKKYTGKEEMKSLLFAGVENPKKTAQKFLELTYCEFRTTGGTLHKNQSHSYMLTMNTWKSRLKTQLRQRKYYTGI